MEQYWRPKLERQNAIFGVWGDAKAEKIHRSFVSSFCGVLGGHMMEAWKADHPNETETPSARALYPVYGLRMLGMVTEQQVKDIWPVLYESMFGELLDMSAVLWVPMQQMKTEWKSEVDSYFGYTNKDW